MRAVVFEEFGGPLTVRDVAAPEPAPDGVVVRVGATGVCRSDWHGWQGHDSDIRVLPHVPGHELAGTVEAVGRRVRRWHAGDRVTVPFVCACGHCPECVAGEQQVCRNQTQPGFTHWGSFAELVGLDAADVNLVALPDGMTFGVAASLGCRYATAFRAVAHRARVRPGEWVAIHGCGGVGLSAIQVAVALGAHVVAVDRSGEALALAASLGAAAVVDATVPDVRAAVVELTDGGAHVSVDAWGNPGVSVTSIGSLRRRGRHVQVGLMPPALGVPAVPMDLVLAHELDILGSHGMPAHDYPEMLAYIASGRLHPELLVTRELSLDEAPDALRSMGSVPGISVVTRM
jgi:alcohol dehydrogenase